MMNDQKPSLLYVDDERENLVVFKRTFDRHFNVSICASAQEAIEMLQSQQFDIVVSDQRMPQMTGVQLFELLANEKVPSARILLTGYADMQSVVEAINKGHIYFYCTKPWSLDEMNLVFRKALEHLAGNGGPATSTPPPEVQSDFDELSRLNDAASVILHRLGRSLR